MPLPTLSPSKRVAPTAVTHGLPAGHDGQSGEPWAGAGVGGGNGRAAPETAPGDGSEPDAVELKNWHVYSNCGFVPLGSGLLVSSVHAALRWSLASWQQFCMPSIVVSPIEPAGLPFHATSCVLAGWSGQCGIGGAGAA